jgi:hypothetical protein
VNDGANAQGSAVAGESVGGRCQATGIGLPTAYAGSLPRQPRGALQHVETSVVQVRDAFCDRSPGRLQSAGILRLALLQKPKSGAQDLAIALAEQQVSLGLPPGTMVLQLAAAVPVFLSVYSVGSRNSVMA